MTVLTFNKSNLLSREETNGIEIIRLPSIFRGKTVRISIKFRELFLKISRRARQIIFNFPTGQPELYYLLYRKIQSEKICVYHADIVEYGVIGAVYNLFFVKRFLDSMDKIIVTSPNIVESSNILKDYKEKIAVIPLFVDTSHFYPRNPNKREYLVSLFPKPPEKIVLYIGRLARYKGLEYLTRAMTMLEEKYGLVIIGKGRKEEELKRFAQKLEVEKRVVFLDHVPYDELPEYYSAADVFVLPSISRAEAFGLVGLEAMACGTPVITTELGTGTSYYNIHEKTGLVVPPKNSKILAESIKRICESDWKNTKKDIIIKRAKEFSLEMFKQRIEEVL
ncbi:MULTISPECIES: glycosyltransferase [unclassified Thermotoga]|uniref:glycosyltransferase n=1 Tax=unclassified Thermotoga TaxID=2631113 RepID=UPI000540D60B|nr:MULTISPECIES: glycosyltransferase [unclassified Thermotoga]AIY87661.1 glycosyl transferase group 1 [Thermotoga sp. Cell2]KHC92592.1 group 1 glycosyl transferase [Thermotoga sp. TBGT1765]KHC93563.1 group 1 glycosyl transferase [Thermotoga sp. TBGT1766]KHC96394.1 group 1 glycosyl transferase [Thermotoga sp. Xyl54]